MDINSGLSLDEKVALCLSVGEETITPQELRTLFEKKKVNRSVMMDLNLLVVYILHKVFSKLLMSIN